MSKKTSKVLFVCGPMPGGRGYLDFCEHAEQKRKRRACDRNCFFCELDRHPEKYECITGRHPIYSGVWKDPHLEGATFECKGFFASNGHVSEAG